MRLLCINNDGCPELELMKIYPNCELGSKCPCCGTTGYIINGISKPDYGSSLWKCCACNGIYKKTSVYELVDYSPKRFINLDDLTEIEKQEYSTELENA